MKFKLFLQVIILCLLIGSARAEYIAPSEARAWVTDKGNLLLDAFSEDDIEKKYAMLDDMFLNNVDLDYIAKFVVGRYWKIMTAEQKKEYTDLFKRYALATYKKFPLDFKDRVSFKVNGVTTNGKFTDVSSNIKIKDVDKSLENILVIFKLDKHQGQIKIVDLKLMESSLILAYRQRFYKMITDSDEEISWFIEDFTAMVTAAEYELTKKHYE